MGMSDNIYSAKDMITETITSLFRNISAEQFSQTKSMYKAWQSILLSIKSTVTPDCGQKMLDHSKIVDVKDGIMYIELDHPGWMQLFETYRTYILNGISYKMSNLNVKTLSYKLKKNDDKNSQRVLTREEAEKAVEKLNPVNDKNLTQDLKIKENLPPELEAIFSRFKDTILTNNQ